MYVNSGKEHSKSQLAGCRAGYSAPALGCQGPEHSLALPKRDFIWSHHSLTTSRVRFCLQRRRDEAPRQAPTPVTADNELNTPITPAPPARVPREDADSAAAPLRAPRARPPPRGRTGAARKGPRGCEGTAGSATRSPARLPPTPAGRGAAGGESPPRSRRRPRFTSAAARSRRRPASAAGSGGPGPRAPPRHAPWRGRRGLARPLAAREVRGRGAAVGGAARGAPGAIVSPPQGRAGRCGPRLPNRAGTRSRRVRGVVVAVPRSAQRPELALPPASG